MLRDGEDSFPLLPFSPQRGHLHRVRLIILYPQTSQCCDTQSLCVLVWISHLWMCLCAFVWVCILILTPSICPCACLCVCVSYHVLACASVLVCVGGGHRRHVCTSVGIYDTFYLFTVVPPVVTASPRGNKALLMVLISDMSQTVCLTGEYRGREINRLEVCMGEHLERREKQRNGDATFSPSNSAYIQLICICN